MANVACFVGMITPTHESLPQCWESRTQHAWCTTGLTVMVSRGREEARLWGGSMKPQTHAEQDQLLNTLCYWTMPEEGWKPGVTHHCRLCIVATSVCTVAVSVLLNRCAVPGGLDCCCRRRSKRLFVNMGVWGKGFSSSRYSARCLHQFGAWVKPSQPKRER